MSKNINLYNFMVNFRALCSEFLIDENIAIENENIKKEILNCFYSDLSLKEIISNVKRILREEFWNEYTNCNKYEIIKRK